jgi:hypothetical protein
MHSYSYYHLTLYCLSYSQRRYINHKQINNKKPRVFVGHITKHFNISQDPLSARTLLIRWSIKVQETYDLHIPTDKIFPGTNLDWPYLVKAQVSKMFALQVWSYCTAKIRSNLKRCWKRADIRGNTMQPFIQRRGTTSRWPEIYCSSS